MAERLSSARDTSVTPIPKTSGVSFDKVEVKARGRGPAGCCAGSSGLRAHAAISPTR